MCVLASSIFNDISFGHSVLFSHHIKCKHLSSTNPILNVRHTSFCHSQRWRKKKNVLYSLTSSFWLCRTIEIHSTAAILLLRQRDCIFRHCIAKWQHGAKRNQTTTTIFTYRGEVATFCLRPLNTIHKASISQCWGAHSS